MEDADGNSYCLCGEQFDGEYCLHQSECEHLLYYVDVYISAYNMTITSILCRTACFCLNGGFGCDNETVNGTCTCLENYTGEHCEYEICESIVRVKECQE